MIEFDLSQYTAGNTQRNRGRGSGRRVTLGGARPKALLDHGGHQWILKFNEPGETIDTPLVEHATMTLAVLAGIRVATTMPLKMHKGHAVAVRRFDRDGGGRQQTLSARLALHAAGEPMGYPELAQWLRRRGVAARGLNAQHMQELFRRKVFNILMTESGEYELASASDVLPSAQALGFQPMRVGAAAADATLDNASVCAADIESLSCQVDRPFYGSSDKLACSPRLTP
jgi:serine/threonine-protein kinase HipA